MVYAISQERNILIDNEVQRILQASMDKGEIEQCIDQIIGINHGEEGEKEDAR